MLGINDKDMDVMLGICVSKDWILLGVSQSIGDPECKPDQMELAVYSITTTRTILFVIFVRFVFEYVNCCQNLRSFII
jgi:hypothetical protein